MYIVAIAWIYVVLLMSLTEVSFTAGLATFVFYGLLPLSVLGYLMDAPGRRRRRRAQAAHADTDGNTAEGIAADRDAPGASPQAAAPAPTPIQSASQISEAMRPLPASRRKE